MSSAVDKEIADLIRQYGRITFAQFMQTCLYSRTGGFYASRDETINAHFGTSPMSHPVFGALIARQLEQMWHILGAPSVFHVIEVGAGDGSLAQAVVHACRQTAPRLARALVYVAADYEPRCRLSPAHGVDWGERADNRMSPSAHQDNVDIQKVQTAGLCAFRNVVGCIVCNELLDNFPVHRFAIQSGSVKEVFVTSVGGVLTEVLGEPSSPRIEQRLSSLGLALPDGYRGEVNLAIADWTAQICAALDRGFVLTIDYGELASDLYGPENNQGTLVCHHRHIVGNDPYQSVGQQDITCQVDFTSLMRLGERHGLRTVGYALQSEFLTNLGFASYLDTLQAQGLSAARTELSRMAMMTLVDPQEYGNFKVLAQTKGTASDTRLLGFENR